jgi:hypothetical protein
MRIPPEIARRVVQGRSLGFKCLHDGTVTDGFESGWGGGAYPPPGYLPWNILEVGNGDTYGYYWPIGKENDPPIVCTVMHDGWAMLPVTSSLNSCIRLLLLTDHADTEQLVEVASDFGIDISDIPIPEEDDEKQPASLDGPPWTDIEPGGIEFWGAPSAHDLLQHDPLSPHLQFVAAKEAITNQQLAEAEAHLRVALSSLPEYSDALALLAQIYRQQRDHRRTAQTLMEAITSPRCFGAGDRKKLLNWLQRLDNNACPGCDDPLWKRRKELTFVEGVKEKADYRIIEELIDEYHSLGMGIRAVRLRILAGELMGSETVSFRERSNWSGATFRSQLKSDLERAGLLGRLTAVEFPKSVAMPTTKMERNEPESENIKYLNQLAERITLLHAELLQSGADEAGDVFQDKFRTLHRLKEEYKRLTGIYPNLPPYE